MYLCWVRASVYVEDILHYLGYSEKRATSVHLFIAASEVFPSLMRRRIYSMHCKVLYCACFSDRYMRIVNVFFMVACNGKL